jgi:hypothetical protein
MPDTVMRWMAAAAFIAALGTPADAADLSPLHHLTTGRMVCSVICLVRHPVMYLLLHRGAICLRVNPVNMLATRF